jgi:hypothetical protein
MTDSTAAPGSPEPADPADRSGDLNAAPTPPPSAPPETRADATAAQAAADQQGPHERGRSERRRPSADDDHRFRHPLLVIISIVVVSIIAIAINRIEPAQPGAFYDDASVPAGSPGAVIRTQPITGLPTGTQGWKVLYTSTGLDGQPIAVSGTVFVPSSPAPPGGRPVVAWAHPTTGVAPRCAPSLGTAGGLADIPGAATFLAAGDAVVATDYPGLGTPGPHPYLVGASEGRAVLDAVRAAHQLPAVASSTTFAVWGHSQGGQAALFTGQLATSYAPELSLVGVAAAAPATELSALLQHDSDGPAGNVLTSMAVVSWAQVYADQGLAMNQVLSDTAIPTARLIADECIESREQLMVDLPEIAIEEKFFLAAGSPPWTNPTWTPLLQANTPGATAIRVPVLIDQGSADTIVWPGITADWVAAQCRAGVAIDEQTYPGVTHTDIGFTAAPATAAWLAARFAHQPAPSGCSSAAADPAAHTG